MPGNLRIQECYDLVRVSTAKTYTEMEAVAEKIMEQIQKDGRGASGAEKGKERYRAALTRAWERLGYPKELAQIRTDLIFHQRDW